MLPSLVKRLPRDRGRMGLREEVLPEDDDGALGTG